MQQEPKENSKGKDVQTDAIPAQTDLAEGELETVEESIRIHEEKGDAQGRTPHKNPAAG